MANKLISGLNPGTRPKRGDLFEMEQVAGGPPGTSVSTKVSLGQFIQPAIDVPPDIVSAHALDDEFDGATLNVVSKWTWRNQGFLTYELIESMLHTNCDNTGVHSLRYVMQALPAGLASWEMTTKVTFITPPPIGNTGVIDLRGAMKFVGLVVGQVATTRTSIIFLVVDAGILRIYSQRFLAGVWQTTSFLFDAVPQYPWYWLRIVKNGTNFLFYASMDGIIFHQLGAEALATWVNTPDEVGLVFNAGNNTGARFHALVDYFRFKTP